MNANSIQLSVLVPIYGVERYIGDCARSLFDQSMVQGVEFIFVDDASPDGSVDELNRVLAEFPGRVDQVRQLHHEQNRGLAAARCTAIDAARGEWILHVDSDDVVCPGALATLFEATTEQVDMVFGNYFAADDPAQTEPNDRAVVRMPEWSRERLLHALLTQSHRISNRTWGILIRRTLCVDNHIYPIEGINFAEDYAVVPRLLHAACGVKVLPHVVYGYRLASDGSYMKRLDARAAAQYVAANRVVTDYVKRQADYETLRASVILGRLNIEKWILKRGLSVEAYDAELFCDGDRPRRLLPRIYAAAIERGNLFWVRLMGLLANAGA